MIFKLKEKCLESSEKEVFYGAKINKAITDVYLGLGFLEPEETRKEGPGKGHEEILYLLEGQVRIQIKDEELILNEGEAYYISDGQKVTLTNLASKRSYFVMAGGHTKKSHHH